MDRYPFEDEDEKPYQYTSKKKEEGLGIDYSLTCLMYIYLNSWNSQAVVNKITTTGIWRGLVALVLVTYFFTLPTVILCLYLGKFLKHGSLSLYKCCPLLLGVGMLSFIFAFPLGGMMVYYPLSENIFMQWVTKYNCHLPTCTILRMQTNFSGPCIEEKMRYNCCAHHGVVPYNIKNCVQPLYSFYLLNNMISEVCSNASSIFLLQCDYWLIFFFVCIVVILVDIKGFHKVLKFCEKFYMFNIFLINWWNILHFEVLVTGLWYYYKNFEVQEDLVKTFFDLFAMEVDHLSISLPFLLMVGRLIDDEVQVDQLAIKLAAEKIIRQFWQANEYIGVISVVASYHGVKYICLHNIKEPTIISLGVIPEFFSISRSRIVKFPAMFLYFCSIFFKKVASMVLYGNLLTYHIYYWEKKRGMNPIEKLSAASANVKGKFILILVKVIVYALLSICQRIFNLNVQMIPLLKIAFTITLAIQLVLFSIFLLTIYSVSRFRTDVEAVTQKKLWPELLTHLKIQPFLSMVFAMIRLFQYYVTSSIGTETVTAHEIGASKSPLYKLLPLFYLIPALVISALYILFNLAFKFELRLFQVSKDWGPVNKSKWINIRPFDPGRKLIFYDYYRLSNHICFLKHHSIKHVSNEQIDNVELFIQKWPKIFTTNKYKHHKKEVDALVTEAYKWGILASFEQNQDDDLTKEADEST